MDGRKGDKYSTRGKRKRCRRVRVAVEEEAVGSGGKMKMTKKKIEKEKNIRGLEKRAKGKRDEAVDRGKGKR